MIDVDHRRLGKKPQRLRLDDEHIACAEFFDAHMLIGQFAVRRLVFGRGKDRGIVKRHRGAFVLWLRRRRRALALALL